MRICNQCGSSENGFERHRRVCKKCRNEYKSNYGKTHERDRVEEKQYFYRTKEGRIKYMYYNQLHASKKRGHCLPEYTKEELIEWCLHQEKYHTLHDSWAKSNYNKKLTPSIDRIDNKKSYGFSNIQLTTWEENDILAHEHCKKGLISSGNKCIAVSQYTLNGEYMQSFPTMNEACRYLNKICHKEISKCCKGIYKQTQGYIWRFADDGGLLP